MVSKRLKRIEHKTWLYIKRTLITIVTITVILFLLLIALSAG